MNTDTGLWILLAVPYVAVWLALFEWMLDVKYPAWLKLLGMLMWPLSLTVACVYVGATGIIYQAKQKAAVRREMPADGHTCAD